jgi:hypothetical protein
MLLDKYNLADAFFDNIYIVFLNIFSIGRKRE